MRRPPAQKKIPKTVFILDWFSILTGFVHGANSSLVVLKLDALNFWPAQEADKTLFVLPAESPFCVGNYEDLLIHRELD